MNTTEEPNIGPFTWNNCYYIDCVAGLKQLPDQCIDLCLTDPPFNLQYVGIGSNQKRFNKKEERSETVTYQDDLPDYKAWCDIWFNEVKRVTKRQVIFVGRQNIKYWVNEMRDIGVWVKPDGNGRGGTFWFVKHEFFITSGSWGNDRMIFSVITENANGFFKETKGFIHPCPRPSSLYLKIIKESKAKNVLDPFIGSGTTAQACIIAGKNWLGFEKEQNYKHDIDKRIELSKKELNNKQMVLF